MKKTESEVAKTTAALEKANTELVEIAKRIEDIKRFQDKATSKSAPFPWTKLCRPWLARNKGQNLFASM